MALSKLTLNIGMASVPVRIENFIGDGTKPKGSYVCETSKTPIKGSGGGFSVCQEKHEGACSRVIGYDRGDGSYFVPEEIAAEKDGQVNFTTFVPAEEIDPAYFAKTYVVKPDPKGGEQAAKVFWLIAARLKKLNRVAVGSAVLDKDEKMVFLRYSKALDAIFFCVGCFHEQLKFDALNGAESGKIEKFTPAENKLMDEIMTKVYVEPFDALKVKPERWHQINALIAGEAVDTPHEPLPEVPNLMDKLQATIEQGKAAKTKTTAKKTAKK